MQEEVEGRNVLKVTICFSGETPGDTDLPLEMDTRGDFRSHIKEVVVHAGMDDLRIVASVAVTAERASAILTVNRDKKREILITVSSNDRSDRANIIAV